MASKVMSKYYACVLYIILLYKIIILWNFIVNFV